jgi:hypothetical protein
LKTERQNDKKKAESALKQERQKDRKKQKKDYESTLKQELFDSRAEDFLNTQISRMYRFDL